MNCMPAYRPDDVYHHMLDHLEHIARNFEPAAPDDLRTQIIIALGEIGNVWPASCITDEEHPAAESCERNENALN